MSSQPSTFVTRLTPQVPSAIATIVIRGERALELTLSQVEFRRSELRVGRVLYGTIQITTTQPAGGREQVVLCQTASDEVELHCHGGTAICRAILNRFVSQGCCLVDANEWPSRWQCPISQAAERDLLMATTDRVACILLDQLNGALAKAIRRILDELEADQTASALQRLRELQSRVDFGLHLSSPWKIVLAGPPNVGKSSLLNAILGQSRSIVHAEAGTTRDWIEAHGAIHGWPVTLTDTAGLRTSVDEIESEGVRRAQQQVQHADLLVLVVDAVSGWSEVHEDLMRSKVERKLIAWNKADLGGELPPTNNWPCPAISTSAITEKGTEELIRAMASLLIPDPPLAGRPVPFRKEQAASIAQAITAVQAGEPWRAKTGLVQLLVPWTRGQELA